MLVREPLLGQLNQGSIFSCAKAERYFGCMINGVVLTARCDLEQDKYNVLNYAPIVPLADWLRVDGYEVILARIAADLDSRIISALKSIDMPASILHSQTPGSILRNYIRASGAENKLKKAEAKFVELDGRVGQLVRWRNGFSDTNRDMFKDCDALVRSVVKELIHHRLAGYYFLPRLEPGGEETGFVALLREVNHLPRGLALLIAQGVDSSATELMQCPEWLTFVDFGSAGFAMPVGEIGSPEVEHLLQTFSHLFGRIGLPDPDFTKVDIFCGIRPR